MDRSATDELDADRSSCVVPRRTAREIVLHVIAETATHPGQLDVVREAIEGRRWLEFA